jgi:hypothetical protein
MWMLVLKVVKVKLVTMTLPPKLANHNRPIERVGAIFLLLADALPPVPPVSPVSPPPPPSSSSSSSGVVNPLRNARFTTQDT